MSEDLEYISKILTEFVNRYERAIDIQLFLVQFPDYNMQGYKYFVKDKKIERDIPRIIGKRDVGNEQNRNTI